MINKKEAIEKLRDSAIHIGKIWAIPYSVAADIVADIDERPITIITKEVRNVEKKS